jgi:hypothetical protein
LIVDHFDLVMEWSRCSATECIETLRATAGGSVLVLVSSWERALELKKCGASLLTPDPGFGRWTADELSQLFETYPSDVRARWTGDRKAELMQRATLSGSPGLLMMAAFGIDHDPLDLRRARLIDAEWRNGTCALTCDTADAAVGRFPDRHGVFHWK